LPTYWLLIERLENWEIDQKQGFVRFGLPEKARLAQKIKKGDLLIFYISSGLSAFSDIREATADGTTKLPFGGDYDTAFPLSISTRPYLTLRRSDWVPIHHLLDKLEITSGKKDWRQVVRTTLKHLSDKDARVIIDAMKKASQNRVNFS
jgi:predicted RNA-binding protein